MEWLLSSLCYKNYRETLFIRFHLFVAVKSVERVTITRILFNVSAADDDSSRTDVGRPYALHQITCQCHFRARKNNYVYETLLSASSRPNHQCEIGPSFILILPAFGGWLPGRHSVPIGYTEWTGGERVKQSSNILLNFKRSQRFAIGFDWSWSIEALTTSLELESFARARRRQILYRPSPVKESSLLRFNRKAFWKVRLIYMLLMIVFDLLRFTRAWSLRGFYVLHIDLGQINSDRGGEKLNSLIRLSLIYCLVLMFDILTKTSFICILNIKFSEN